MARQQGLFVWALLFTALVVKSCNAQEYTADWESIDSRPLPQWFDDAKIGIFLHWGVYSVPSYGSEWFWMNWKGYKNPKDIKFMKENYPPGFTYQDFAPQFTAEFYDPDQWADLFEAAGAKYVVLTSKHHEGFTMWPSKYSWGWNAMDVGAKRDLLGDLADSIRNRTNLKFGLYHSLYEWFNPLYLQDKNNSFQTYDFRDMKTMPELYEITNTYKPEIIWSDGEWEVQDYYWNSTVYLSWLFNESPVKDTVVVNDRWGSTTLCKHGSFYTCADRYNPGVLQPHKWENAMTIDKRSWGYRRVATYDDYLSADDLITTLAQTISCGGNLLVNTGPTHDGRIAPIMEERLRQMGEWLGTNGEAIYASQPWLFQNDTYTSGVWYTQRNDSVYATVLDWPDEGTVTLGVVTPDVIQSGQTLTTSMLGFQGTIGAVDTPSGLEVTFPSRSKVAGTYAWVLKMQGVTLK